MEVFGYDSVRFVGARSGFSIVVVKLRNGYGLCIAKGSIYDEELDKWTLLDGMILRTSGGLLKHKFCDMIA